ncbi:uncharacterized protein LOC9649878 [Selaginella moellendorffii]|uniref:uncharacterized protein LOC9649878 n=1 Tax=Selaginella moellendorffii TaxID=88036 RepID=UPI000D1CA150|nr:uncharacterized protein LOC9649878 [Selaginella moellendorffii]|eukprot:XP_024515146.1 uncharacterized protein LOC9649878 [Selaginella moellendorffii]
MACEELARAIITDCAVWRDPQFQRSSKVWQLRYALQTWATEMKRVQCYDIDVSRAIQSCARLEQKLNHCNSMDAYQCNQEQVSSLYTAAEAILAAEEMRNATAERINVALDASIQQFGSRGVVPRMFPSETMPHLLTARKGEIPLKPHAEGWHPRWPGDIGDPFEPYMQLLEQFLHSALTFHARAMEQLTAAFGAVRAASKNARDAAYTRTQAAAVGISVKEYQRLLDMFTKIDSENTGKITKGELMVAMKRDKDIAAFMQLSRARNKDGRRESFESVFSRIDNTGIGAISWEQFLYFSTGRSLIGENMCPSLCPTMAPSSPGRQPYCCS